MAKLIYIGGFGRSGSTLLEYLLTSNPDVVACGEVARHLRRLRTQKKCTCGVAAKDCSVWGPFQIGAKRGEGLDHRTLTLTVLQHVSADFGTMVDSSKTAWGSSLMPFRLRHNLGSDFLLVHIVRDPRGVCWSTIKSSMRKRPQSGTLYRCLKTTIGWTAANLACELFGLFHRRQYVRIRYEDLVHEPGQAIKRILHGKSSPPAQLAEGRNRHQLYGNGVRFKPMSLSKLEEDLAWKVAMPERYRLLAALTLPLAAKYGYFKS